MQVQWKSTVFENTYNDSPSLTYLGYLFNDMMYKVVSYNATTQSHVCNIPIFFYISIFYNTK
jgi:hypothetical protein